MTKIQQLIVLLGVLVGAAAARAQYVLPPPQPIGGPVTYLKTNATLTSSAAASFVNVSGTEVDVVYNVTGTISGAGAAIVFSLASVDPQQTSSSVSGDPPSVSSPSISSSGGGAGVLSLGPIGSSGIVVSWSVSGSSPSIGGVNLTVIVKPVGKTPKVFNLSHTVVCLSAGTPAEIPAAAGSGRTMVTVGNQSPETVYCAPTSSVTVLGGALPGAQLVSGASGAWQIPSNEPLYCVAAAGQLGDGGCLVVDESVPQ